MSPRQNRRCRDDSPLHAAAALGSAATRETGADGQWWVRMVAGVAAVKTYRCPGCAGEVLPGTVHLVAWPADDPDGSAHRRHWHRSCWQQRDRRRPIG